MEIGQYGRFNSEWYIVLDVRETKLLVINGSGTKKQIASKNFEPRANQIARVVRYAGTDYLITKTKLIISMTSYRLMQWSKKHGVRKSILALKGIERCKAVLANSQYKLEL